MPLATTPAVTAGAGVTLTPGSVSCDVMDDVTVRNDVITADPTE